MILARGAATVCLMPSQYERVPAGSIHLVDPAISIALRIAAAEMCEIIGARRDPAHGARQAWSGPARQHFDEARTRLDARAGDLADHLARAASQG